MAKYFDMLMEDVRFREGLHACMNCGVCTGVCPAAEFYNYDPRQIVSIVQTRDDEAIERLRYNNHLVVIQIDDMSAPPYKEGPLFSYVVRIPGHRPFLPFQGSKNFSVKLAIN